MVRNSKRRNDLPDQKQLLILCGSMKGGQVKTPYGAIYLRKTELMIQFLHVKSQNTPRSTPSLGGILH